MDEDKRTTEVREVRERVDGGTVQRQTVSSEVSPSGAVVFKRVIWYVAGVIIVLLVLRMVLQLMGANNSAGFVHFIYSVSGVFAAPFFGIFSYSPKYGSSYFEVSTLVAVAVYALVAWGIGKLATIAK